MKTNDFLGLIDLVKDLTRRQRARLILVLEQARRAEDALSLVEEATSNFLACPRCRSAAYQRYGFAHGVQRYRCKACKKTFNTLTSTPLAHLRKRSKWLEFADCMLSSMTVRKAAAFVGVHKNTSFRWRHRFLQLPKTDRPEKLSGITEADETYFLESEKGSRKLGREPRRRGGVATKRGVSDEQICVLIARDRTGQTIDFVAGKGPVTKAQLHRCMPAVLHRDALLVSDSNAAYKYFAKEAGITHKAVNLRQKRRVSGAFHIQNVNAYHSRLKEWIYQFHGVATHYLPNYLGWRWALDLQRIATPEAFFRAAVGDFNTYR